MNTKNDVTGVVIEDVHVTEKEQKVRKKRVHRNITHESIEDDFNKCIKNIENEIEHLKQDKYKTKGIKFLKSLKKSLNILKEDTKKLTKKNTRKNNGLNKSGFKKNVPVSIELTKFCNWTVGDLHSRYDATNIICSYIKDNDLQDKNDRRIIIGDEKLKQLLEYNKNEHGLLKYPTIQKLIQIHFHKE